MTWWSKVLKCPVCGGALREADVLVRCSKCGPYPLLAGIPVLVGDPYGWCARFRESILATLAEFDAADTKSVEVVRAFAAESSEGPELFGDDWTEHEVRGEPEPEPVEGPVSAALVELMNSARANGPAAWLAKTLPTRARLVLEVGCGAGARSEVLAQRADQLIIGDLSLRAVLRARQRAMRFKAEVVGVVLDAHVLPVKAGAVDVVVAEHLVDLLDAPAAFFESARAAVKKNGRVLLTSPEPRGFDELAKEAGLRVVSRADGLPWLRVNSERFVEVYLVEALELR